MNKSFAAGFALVIIGECVRSIPELFLWNNWPNLVRAAFVKFPPFLTFGFLSGVIADWLFAQQNRAVEVSVLVLIWIIVKFLEYILDYNASFLKPIHNGHSPQKLYTAATLVYIFALAISLLPFIIFQSAHGINVHLTRILCILIFILFSALFFLIPIAIGKHYQKFIEIHFVKIIEACHVGSVLDHNIFEEFEINRLDQTEIKALRECVERAHVSINSVNSLKLMETLDFPSGTILTAKQLRESTFKAQRSVLIRLEKIRAICWVISGDQMQVDEGIQMLKKHNISDTTFLQERRRRLQCGITKSTPV